MKRLNTNKGFYWNGLFFVFYWKDASYANVLFDNEEGVYFVSFWKSLFKMFCTAQFELVTLSINRNMMCFEPLFTSNVRIYIENWAKNKRKFERFKESPIRVAFFKYSSFVWLQKSHVSQRKCSSYCTFWMKMQLYKKIQPLKLRIFFSLNELMYKTWVG